jgi:hypothetical protein
MLSFISGLIIAAGGVAGLWAYRPRNGVVHPVAVMPVLEWALPIAIITALALGLGLAASAVVL